MKSFASDNYAGVLPEVMTALNAANTEHERSYMADTITHRTLQLFRDIIGMDVDVYYVFNGTGANVLSISSATQSYNSVLCSDFSHIYNDESSAPETFTGCRYFPIPTHGTAKMLQADIVQRLIRKGDIHYAQAGILSVTQSTEYGTLYTIDELKAIKKTIEPYGLYYHMDGSRLFNAMASMGCTLKEIVTETGLDILSLGGTKAGMMYGEAVIVINPDLKQHIAYKHKQSMQLASKSRFIAAQFEALLKDELWRKYAAHSNAMAQYLYATLSKYPEIRVTQAVQANVVFAELPMAWTATLQEQFPFYIWKAATNEARLMCSFDTTTADIDSFDNLLQRMQEMG